MKDAFSARVDVIGKCFAKLIAVNLLVVKPEFVIHGKIHVHNMLFTC